MLEGYFDDSGTDDRSDLLVWGGVLGDTAQFDALRAQWAQLLLQPMEGKPPIKAFHASHIANSYGEFSDYKPPERDILFRAFRGSIVSSQLVPISFGVIKSAWYDLQQEYGMQLFGSPEQFVFLNCVMSGQRFASIGKAPVKLCFDTARLESSRDEIVSGGNGFFNSTALDVTYSRVADEIGLQAADMVAYEAFVLGNAAKADIAYAKPRLHFQRLLEGAPDAFGFMMGRTEIEAFFSNAQAMLKEGIGNAPTRPPGFQNLFGMLFRNESWDVEAS